MKSGPEQVLLALLSLSDMLSQVLSKDSLSNLTKRPSQVMKVVKSQSASLTVQGSFFVEVDSKIPWQMFMCLEQELEEGHSLTG